MNTKKTYTVEVDINIGKEVLTTYIEVKAESTEEAYQEAVKTVNTTLDIRIEKKPIESLIQDDFCSTLDLLNDLSIRG